MSRSNITLVRVPQMVRLPWRDLAYLGLYSGPFRSRLPIPISHERISLVHANALLTRYSFREGWVYERWNNSGMNCNSTRLRPWRYLSKPTCSTHRRREQDFYVNWQVRGAGTSNTLYASKRVDPSSYWAFPTMPKRLPRCWPWLMGQAWRRLPVEAI